MSNPWRPTGRSPVHYKLVELGAVLEQVSGWQLATHFGDVTQEAALLRSRVGLADRSSIPKWEIKGLDMGQLLRSIVGEAIPDAGRVVLAGSGSLCRVSPNHVLFFSDRENEAVPDQISEASRLTGCIHVTDRTSGLGSFLLCGPKAGLVLRKLTSLDLREASFPNLSCRAAPMAAVQTLVVRKDRDELLGYQIFFNREYGEYLWDAVIQAGREFQIGPFGLAAERLLRH